MAGARLLGLEDRLAADAGGVERDRLLAHLGDLARQARASLDKGVAPRDARRLMALLAALEAAQVVAMRVWAHLHVKGR